MLKKMNKWTVYNMNRLILNSTKMPLFSREHSYLKRDSRDSQISFCFTVFQEKSSSSKAKRVRTVILHLFNHVDSFFRPWTKRMQYPILEKKKNKGKGTNSYIPALWFICKTIQYCIYYSITGGFGLITLFQANKLQFNSSFPQFTTQFTN